MNDTEASSSDGLSVEAVLDRVRSHEFHPVDETGFTVDRTLEEHGIADLDDDDWRVRLLAVRDLVRFGDAKASEIAVGLADDDVQVRYVCATALGILRSRSEVESLERVVREDPDALARSQAIVALGQIGATRSLDLLRDRYATTTRKTSVIKPNSRSTASKRRSRRPRAGGSVSKSRRGHVRTAGSR